MVPFNRPAITGAEQAYLAQVFERGKFAGGGPFNERCNAWLRGHFDCPAALATTSCSHALEIAALLCDLEPGDEVIVPSFAFPSTASAFARCGASLVFVDVEAPTMNLDVEAVAAALTPKTRVVVVLHYAGVACRMDELLVLARERELIVVEDAAQALFAEHRDRPCGTLGTFGCLSFHETKNIHCGEGGALIVNDGYYVQRAEIIHEKGTDRRRFQRGQVDFYSWREIGSSYVPGELSLAFLLAQLEHGGEITADRLRSWNQYRSALQPLREAGVIEMAEIPSDCRHNGHIAWIKTRDGEERRRLIAYLAERSIQAVSHYVPLHSSMAGRKYGRLSGGDRVTTSDAERLLRLPLYYRFAEVERVTEAVDGFYGGA